MEIDGQVDCRRMPLGWPVEQDASAGELLGSNLFCERFNVRRAYASGAMYQGIASVELVLRMGNAGLIGFFGAAGLAIGEIEKAITAIKTGIGEGKSFGFNLHAHADLEAEHDVARLYLKHGVKFVEAAAFTRMTPALVHYRLCGISRDAQGRIVSANRIIAKVSRPEVASAFMSPPPSDMVEQLRLSGSISNEEAALAHLIPMSSDICVEADSGGHTDGRIPTVILPAMLELRDEIEARRKYDERICVGLAGGIGEPRAAAAAFIMGADFILTGSINQCSVESAASDSVKDMLQTIDVQDTDYAPAGDLFETGSQVQVLRRGIFFSARAQKLYALYQNYDGIDQIPLSLRQTLERNYFGKPFSEIWDECKSYLRSSGRDAEIANAEANPKRKLVHIFKWYFKYSSDLARAGDIANKVNFQIHTGPALGAFNRWVKGTPFEDWRARHVDEIGYAIMAAAEDLIHDRRNFSASSRFDLSSGVAIGVERECHGSD